jgi:phosphoribosyl 1,2-cyclic phosphodiesterase
MTRDEAVELSKTLKQEKDDLKKLYSDGNSSIKEKESYSTVELIIPATAYKPTKVDWSFQQYFNGFVLAFDGELMIIDPGADFYSRLTQSNLNINDTRAIFVSHKHIDHLADLPLILDMLIKLSRPVDLIMSQDTFDEVLSDFLKEQLTEGRHNINLILITVTDFEVSPKVKWNALRTLKIVSLYHSAPQTFGFRVKHEDKEFLYISDAGYSKQIETEKGIFEPNQAEGNFKRIVSKHDSLREFAQSADIAVININDLFYNRHAHTHLIGWDVIDIFKDSRLKRLVLQHLSPYNARGESNEEIYTSFFARRKV